MNTNREVISGMYASFATGDVPGVLAAMDQDIEWNEAESFPYADGNPYIGPDAIVNGVFARLGEDWETWSLSIDQLVEAEDGIVLALGRYNGKYRATGALLDAQFAHVWWLRAGKVVRFQQFTDTARAREVVSS